VEIEQDGGGVILPLYLTDDQEAETGLFMVEYITMVNLLTNEDVLSKTHL